MSTVKGASLLSWALMELCKVKREELLVSSSPSSEMTLHRLRGPPTSPSLGLDSLGLVSSPVGSRTSGRPRVNALFSLVKLSMCLLRVLMAS
jgi:hypothetical protein